MMRNPIAVLLVLAAALSGCAAIDDMTDGEVRASNGRPGFQVSVQRGEGLDSVAQRLGVSRDLLIQANRLAPPYTLHEYQVLYVPPPATYRVKPDDTVEDIAAALGVEEGALAVANGLHEPYHMRVGQILRVPGGFGGESTPAPRAAEPGFEGVEPPPRSTISAQPLAPPGAATVMPQPPPPTAPPIYAPPSYSPPPYIPPQSRTIPQDAPPRQAYAPPMVLAPPTVMAPPPVMAPPAQPTSRPTPPPPAQVAQAPAAPQPAQPSPPLQPSPKIAAAAPAEDGNPHFLRPVAGQLVQGFGPDGSGQTNEGINIAAPAGTPVKAAASGTVIYAGNELPAFGNLLLIRHDGGWVTAYGHLDTIGVQRGAPVTQGQAIGTVGQTGSAKSPQLHFEVRQGSRPVDPSPFLK